MSATTEQSVRWLQLHKDPERLIRWLCKRGLDYKTLCNELEQITNLWCEVYGDNAVKESVAYKSGVQRIEKYLQRKDKSSVQSVTKFLQLPFYQQYKLQANGMLHDYTGCATVDAVLNELVVLPPHIQGLRVTCRASKCTTKVQQQAFSAQTSSVGVPYARASVPRPSAPAPSTGAKRKRMTLLHREPAEESNVTKRKLSKVLHTVDMQAQLAKMVEVLHYSRAKPFELACALAFVSGRSLAELMSLGHFSISIDDNSSDSASSHPGVLFKLHKSNSLTRYSVPLLCDAGTFLAGVDRLRQLKLVQGKECKDINKSHCKTANTAAKTMLGCSTAVFTDLRVAYAALAYNLHSKEPSTSNEALERQMQAWLAQCLPCTKSNRSRAFLTQCCDTYFALAALQSFADDPHAPVAQDGSQGAQENNARREFRKFGTHKTSALVCRVLTLLIRLTLKQKN
jgi:Telomere resolvase